MSPMAGFLNSLTRSGRKSGSKGERHADKHSRSTSKSAYSVGNKSNAAATHHRESMLLATYGDSFLAGSDDEMDSERPEHITSTADSLVEEALADSMAARDNELFETSSPLDSPALQASLPPPAMKNARPRLRPSERELQYELERSAMREHIIGLNLTPREEERLWEQRADRIPYVRW